MTMTTFINGTVYAPFPAHEFDKGARIKGWHQRQCDRRRLFATNEYEQVVEELTTRPTWTRYMDAEGLALRDVECLEAVIENIQTERKDFERWLQLAKNHRDFYLRWGADDEEDQRKMFDANAEYAQAKADHDTANALLADARAALRIAKRHLKAEQTRCPHCGRHD